MKTTYIRSGLFALITALFSTLSFAAVGLEDCTHNEDVGDKCKAVILEIHPTQFSVGMFEVAAKKRELAELSDDDLKEYVHKHPAPVVIGPGREFYLIDHHHLALTLLKLGKGKMVVEIVKSGKTLDKAAFWKRMVDKNWAFLYDSEGNGPLHPSKLPRDLTDMQDDPYRSLAWAVREKGGFKKSPIPFAEFQWAQFFRERIKISRGAAGFQKAAREALALAKDSSAKNLPGYVGSR